MLHIEVNWFMVLAKFMLERSIISDYIIMFTNRESKFMLLLVAFYSVDSSSSSALKFVL